MINKLIIDGVNTELDENSPMPYTYTFSQAKVHTVKIALDDTDEICAEAFKDCPNLTKITIPDEITMIKRRAFENCTGLKTITIPDTIEYIGAHVFDGCKNLSEIHFEATTPPSVYCDIPDSATCFVPDGSKYLEYDVTKSEVDTTGDTKYYTRNFYHAFSEILDPNKVDKSGAVTYYIDGWVDLCPNETSKEEKDRIPVEDIVFSYTSVRLENGSTFKLTYTLFPEDETNHHIYWTESSNGLAKIADDSLPNTVYISIGNVARNGGTSLTAYAESGAYKTITFNIYNPETTTEEETVTTEEPTAAPTTTEEPTFIDVLPVVYAADGTVDTTERLIEDFSKVRAAKIDTNDYALNDDTSIKIKVKDLGGELLKNCSTIQSWEDDITDENMAKYGDLGFIRLNNKGKYFDLETPINVRITKITICGIPNKNLKDYNNSWIAIDPLVGKVYDSNNKEVAYTAVPLYEWKSTRLLTDCVQNVQKMSFTSNGFESYTIEITDPTAQISFMVGDASDANDCKSVWTHMELYGYTDYVKQQKLTPEIIATTEITELSSLCSNTTGDGMLAVSDTGKVFTMSFTGETEKIFEDTNMDIEGIACDTTNKLIYLGTEYNYDSSAKTLKSQNNVYRLSNDYKTATSIVSSSVLTSFNDYTVFKIEDDESFSTLAGRDGFEAIEFIGNNTFILGNQKNYNILIKYNTSEGIQNIHKNLYTSEIADLHYDATNNELYILDSDEGYIAVCDATTYKLNKIYYLDITAADCNPEAIYVDTANEIIYVGYDLGSDASGNKLKCPLVKFSYKVNTDTDADDSGSDDAGSADTGSADTGSTDSATPASATILNPEYSDNK